MGAVNRDEAQAAFAALAQSARGYMEMKVDQKAMLLTLRCKVCQTTEEVKLEISAAGDERLYAALKAFQETHNRHGEA